MFYFTSPIMSAGRSRNENQFGNRFVFPGCWVRFSATTTTAQQLLVNPIMPRRYEEDDERSRRKEPNSILFRISRLSSRCEREFQMREEGKLKTGFQLNTQCNGFKADVGEGKSEHKRGKGFVVC